MSDIPSTPNSGIQCLRGGFASGVIRPSGNTFRFPEGRQKSVTPGISSVLLLTYPSAVLRFVIAVVIRSVYRQIVAIAGLFRPCFEYDIISPFKAIADSAPAVMLKDGAVMVTAPLLHGRPNSVKSRIAFAMSFAIRMFSPVAAAGDSFSKSQVAKFDFLNCSAIASTQLFPAARNVLYDCPSPESKTDRVWVFSWTRHVLFMPFSGMNAITKYGIP